MDFKSVSMRGVVVVADYVIDTNYFLFHFFCDTSALHCLQLPDPFRRYLELCYTVDCADGILTLN